MEVEISRPTPTQRRSSHSNSDAKLRLAEAQKQYGRGKKINVKSIRDKKLRGQLRTLENKYKYAALKAKDAEILLEHESSFLEPEGELERTYKVRQDEIKDSVGLETAKKGFELKLEDLGPYRADYTRNGKMLLLAGRKGHVATMDWRDGKLGCELQLKETVRDAKWMHNEMFFAVAQKRYVYIYDHNGVEIHCLDKHVEATNLEFLPYHFLLASVATSGYLKYTDTSTGQLVAELPTRLGSPTSLCQNPHNAILHVGHQNGTVTLWSPNSSTALVKALVHRGPVRSLAVDRQGRYMVSTGQDMRMAIWDIRMFKEVHNYSVFQPGSTVSISDRSLTAVGWGTKVSIWKGLFEAAAATEEKVQSPYMSWGGDGQRIENVRWCPYEDILGVAHNKGFASLIVPGAGEANFDASEANPYENVKQRQEAEVKALLTKLQPEMISLNPDFVGSLDLVSDRMKREEKDLDNKNEDPIEKLKNRGRGRNSALRRYLRKRGSKNVIDEKRLKAETLRKEQNSRVQEIMQREKEELGPVLARFVKK
ncbi:putative U3 small nucleolar RNA-associated protein 7 [Ophidiomyces ophidiicola]|uniref:U3 small nucleolar RNA-associated protein 7 n=1 Tax=Ophidiomyces ophidiicola TaxID=1387563 RepID=A0ACB8UWR9_9EURO|nr:putative U3 small nucleolar RNA-associated protein 7 [Ophidiomyces ophidiicola]KAI1929204.1 putative U3 small nucleolar RNA-associated protein 7 [Ophidiomyces ophidiicola]KAI1963627.1 putative U3 small nucleolar RNA-associated protein 7 [Ophidiomyces ophidiicola]KAI1974052.1 putative U3 small nucleolar RNA-associated protein 7 [Ophidiomyces ophidiicola]KAI2037851.1 putative U3 small nucleolar RNA-associated protein 7 [Ophidiomyces ophidiicola]